MLVAGACPAVKATVKSDQVSPTSVPLGAGRPTFTNYYVQIADDTRLATLTLAMSCCRLLVQVLVVGLLRGPVSER